MKIALFHTTLPENGRKPGGVEVAVHRLANALVDIGEDVSVFSFTDCPPDSQYDHRQLWPSYLQFYRNTALRLLIVPILLNKVSFEGYDVLHIHGDDWFFLRRSLPTVRTLHGSALHEARSASSWQRRLLQYFVYPLEHLSAQVATLTAAVGPGTAQLYNTTNLVNNGVNLQLFRPGGKTSNPTILFVGTWNGRKRGHFVRDIFERYVRPRHPDAELFMVTDACPVATPNVHHIEFPTDKELARLYRRSWVFAYPSTYEGFGIPYIEAMASGTAVICSPNDGANHVLENGKFGLICNDEEFGNQLCELLADDDYRLDIATRGKCRASQFSWQQIADDHVELYNRAVS